MFHIQDVKMVSIDMKLVSSKEHRPVGIHFG